MEILLFSAFILLICAGVWLVYYLKKKHKEYDRLIDQYQKEAAISLAKTENQLKQENKEKLEEVKGDYEEQINDYKEYIDSVKRFSRDELEVNTYKTLLEIKNELVENDVIKPLQMMILPNVFIPYQSVDGDIQSTKIAHIVLLNKGIYIIDTKDWQGNILYGLTKEKAKEFSFIIDTFYPALHSEAEKTFVFEKNKQNELRALMHDEPTKNLNVATSKLNNLLKDQVENITINNLLYFAHPDHHLINFSTQEQLHLINDRNELYAFFIKEIQNKTNLYSVADLEKIKYIVEEADLND
ncbi:nuclease-related domain-containing protein [Pseudalkalibacillus berkeleyi]|uniref:NERD domain-containing protein n=1 Tax=Pseudalkalibacillus berkeleyi TaxID=1069813 RepID=A0ABS9GTF7_9BACL|nr:nuclease-related domain-containing protein [Pseudalkalibacillus berkeleyi]MCF6136114.1 NERD domain-containing protein [Pseudalkalibacillus berkeleyi]